MLNSKTILDNVVTLIKKYPEAKYFPPGGKLGACFNNRGKVVDGPKEEGCIIGQACRMSGVTLEDGEGGVLSAYNRREFQDENGIRFILRRVQERQDSGYTWKEALETACLDTLFAQFPEYNRNHYNSDRNKFLQAVENRVEGNSKICYDILMSL